MKIIKHLFHFIEDFEKIRHRPMWGYYEAFHIWKLVEGSNFVKKTPPRGFEPGPPMGIPIEPPTTLSVYLLFWYKINSYRLCIYIVLLGI